MLVVADSSPLHYLILLDQAELLPRLFGNVLIPDAVAAELCVTASPRKVVSGYRTIRHGFASLRSLPKTWFRLPMSWTRGNERPLRSRRGPARTFFSSTRAQAEPKRAGEALLRTVFGRWLDE